MNVPRMTPLQFAILTLISTEIKGEELRNKLKKFYGIEEFGPKFYQLMDRLETLRWISSRFEQKVINGQIMREKFYRITEHGLLALVATREFYNANR